MEREQKVRRPPYRRGQGEAGGWKRRMTKRAEAWSERTDGKREKEGTSGRRTHRSLGGSSRESNAPSQTLRQPSLSSLLFAAAAASVPPPRICAPLPLRIAPYPVRQRQMTLHFPSPKPCIFALYPSYRRCRRSSGAFPGSDDAGTWVSFFTPFTLPHPPSSSASYRLFGIICPSLRIPAQRS